MGKPIFTLGFIFLVITPEVERCLLKQGAGVVQTSGAGNDTEFLFFNGTAY